MGSKKKPKKTVVPLSEAEKLVKTLTESGAVQLNPPIFDRLLEECRLVAFFSIF